MVDDSQLIKCVILTLRKENVLLPNAVVAEIISVKGIEDVAGAPDWLLGTMNWRGAEVPLLSYEAAGGEKISKVNLNTQAVVLYATGKHGELGDAPYLGLIMSGVPHVSRFTKDQITIDEEADAESEHPMRAQKVRINGASVSILDVDAMVEMVAELAA